MSAAPVISDLTRLLGEGAVRSGPGLERYLVDPRHARIGASDIVLLPESAGQVQAIVRFARQRGLPLVPQGGNTGMVRGAGCDDPRSLIVSLERMNRIAPPDTSGNTLEVGAGAILEQVQQAAEAAGRLFPMRLGAQGSCQVGGLISTNAGGVSALKYGMMRDLVMGIEVVLPDGRLLRDMNRLRKNNVGYDLKQLFIGAEGTLGIVTSAVLKLFPLPRRHETALLAVDSVAGALALYHALADRCAGMISAFEYISGAAVALAGRTLGLTCPLPGAHPHMVLVEIEVPGALGDMELLPELLSEEPVAEYWSDGVVASSEAQRKAFWTLRESLPEAAWRTGRSISHDVSVPLGALPAFMAEAAARLGPGITAAPFGHIGDGNTHYTVIVEEGERDADTIRRINDSVYDCALAHGGSFSAEHGIGRDKISRASRGLPPEAQALRRELKGLLDPAGIMNPEALFAPAEGPSQAAR